MFPANHSLEAMLRKLRSRGSTYYSATVLGSKPIAAFVQAAEVQHVDVEI
jgi:hypothetical protein